MTCEDYEPDFEEVRDASPAQAGECPNCRSVLWRTCGDCCACGASCCDRCARERVDEDHSVGYHATELVCDTCSKDSPR